MDSKFSHSFPIPSQTESTEDDALFRAFGDSIAQLAWAARPDGYIYWYNRRWYEYTGTTPEQMQGWGWQSVHDPRVLPLVLTKWQESIALAEEFDMEFPLLGADGGYRTFLTKAIPLRDDDGKILRWFGTNTDINSRIQAETLLREARDAAEDASRMKDLFLAMISHELRTPLMPVLLLSGAMKNEHSLDHEIREDFAMIHRNIALEARIIDDLLDFTRGRQGKLHIRAESLDLVTTIESALDLLQADISRKHLHIEKDLTALTGTINGDPVRLQQVFWNILRNAAKFSPDCGSIRIIATASAAWFAIHFIDSGIGIAPEDLSNIFKPFHQGRKENETSSGGLGLGLAICEMVVREHGGHIRAESPGNYQGATIIVELPRPQPNPTDS